MSAPFLETLHALATAHDKATRTGAETAYRSAILASANEVAKLLLQVLESTDPSAQRVHDIAGVLLRRELVKEKDSLWHLCDGAHKEMICGQVLHLFEHASDAKIGKIARNCIEPLVNHLAKMIPFWPKLVPTLMSMKATQDDERRMRILQVLPDIVQCDAVNHALVQVPFLAELITEALDSAHTQMQAAGCSVVCAVAEHWRKEDVKPFERFLDPMIKVLTNLASARKTEELKTILASFNGLVEEEPKFFLNHVNPLVTLLYNMCTARGVLDDDVRRSALEFIITLGEEKPKLCVKKCPTFTDMALGSCMAFMAEIEDDPAWSKRMDDEEEDDDECTVAVGTSGIDRVVQSLTVETCQQSLVSAIRAYIAKNVWSATYAALCSIRQAIEYVQDTHVVDQMVSLLAEHTQHAHVRIRHESWRALSQCAIDHQPRLQEDWHARLMPMVARAMEDPEMRVQETSLSFFIAFGEGLDNTHMDLYASGMMEQLMRKIALESHRGVSEEAVTCIGVIATVIEKDFVRYYEQVMPMLHALITNSTNTKTSRLRGKAFECMSLIGMGVGKERFHKDAHVAMEAMIKTASNVDSSDIQSDYIREAVVRISNTLKKDFKPLLQYILPQVYSVLKLEKLTEVAEDVGDDSALIVDVGGKKIKVKTSEMEELTGNMRMLLAFIEDMQDEFFPEVANCAKLLVLYVVSPEGIYYNAEQTREVAFQCWAQLIKSCLKSSAPNASTLATDLLSKVCTGVYAFFQGFIDEKMDDIEEVKINAAGLAACLLASQGKLLPEADLKNMFALPMRLLAHTFEMRSTTLQEKGDVDDDDAEQENQEHDAQIELGELLGALMSSSPKVFQEVGLEPIGSLLAKLFEGKHKLTKDEDLHLALSITCDLIESLQEHSVKGWPLVMPRILAALHHDKANIRQVAAYSLTHAARVPEFAQYVESTLQKLELVIRDKKKFPKKHEDASHGAVDNMVAALLQIQIHHASRCPKGTMELVYSKLPLCHDLVEAEKVHAELLKLVKTQNPVVLGANNEYLGGLIGIFSEVYSSESSNDALNMEIRTTFAAIPRDTLAKFEQSFSEKQIKKIRKVLKDLN